MGKKHPMRHWISLGGKILGAVVIAAPAIKAISTDIQGGYPENIPNDVLQGYTGYDATTGGFNSTQLASGAASIVGGLVLMKVFSYVAKRF